MSCYGRIRGVINSYGTHPGCFWLHGIGIKNQPADARWNTLNNLLDRHSYLILSKDSKEAANYDSGSDTEGEEEAKEKEVEEKEAKVVHKI